MEGHDHAQPGQHGPAPAQHHPFDELGGTGAFEAPDRQVHQRQSPSGGPVRRARAPGRPRCRPRWSRHSNLHQNTRTKRQVRTIDVAPTSGRPGAPRLAALDGLRLLAAFSVLAYHYTGINRDYWGSRAARGVPDAHHLSRYGYLGVELFFIISGFVILMTAYDRTGSPSSPPGWPGSTRRTGWRSCCTFTAPAVLARRPAAHLLEALGNLTMVQNAFEITDVQGAFWTLWIELRFYLLIGVFILIGMTRPPAARVRVCGR